MKKNFILFFLFMCLAFHSQAQGYFENFEASNGGWTASGTGITGNATWQYGTPSIGTASGVRAWKTNLNGNYANSQRLILTSPTINLSALGFIPTFSASVWYEFENQWDQAWVEYSTNNGTTWTKLGGAGTGTNWYISYTGGISANSPAWTGTTNNNWIKVVHAIPAAAASSSTFRLRFVMATDGSIIRRGIAVDDITLGREQDIAVTAITTPVTGQLTGAETIRATVQNAGANPINSFTLTYNVTGTIASTATQTFNTTLAPGASQTVAFTTPANMGTLGGYTVNVTAAPLPIETVTANNTFTTNVDHVKLVTAFPYAEDFETDNGNWISTGGVWEWGIPAAANTVINRAASGTRAWKTRLTGNYPNLNNAIVYLSSPAFNFSSFTSDPEVSFSHLFDAELNIDESWIEYTTNGTTWTKLGTTTSGGNNWYTSAANNWWSGVSGTQWRRAAHKLTGLAGLANVRLRFAFSSDAGTVREGFGIDNIIIAADVRDIEVSAITSPSTAVNLYAPQTVTATLTNNGLSTIPAGYTLNYQFTAPTGAAAGNVTETVNTPIAPGASISYSFTTTQRLIFLGNYTLQVTATLAGDVLPANNTLTKTVIHNVVPATSNCPVLVREDFSTSPSPLVPPTTPPLGPWTVTKLVNNPANGGWDTWMFTNQILAPLANVADVNPRPLPSPMAFPPAMFDSDQTASGSGAEDVVMQTPVFNATGYTSLTLEFDHYFRPLGSSRISVEISTNGTTWTEVYGTTANVGWNGAATTAVHQTVNVSALGGSTTARVRFRYKNNGSWDWYWVVDNVKISSVQPALCNFFTPPVSDLTINEVTCRSIRMSWTDTTSTETGFLVQRATDLTGYGNWVNIATLAPNTTTFTDNNIVIGQVYHYRVQNIIVQGLAPYSTVRTAQPAVAAPFTLGPDVIICDNAPTVVLTSSNLNYTYEWFENGVPVTGGANGRLTVSFTTQNGNPVTRTYRAVGTNPATGCSTFDEINVTVHPNPVANLGDDRNFCENNIDLVLDAAHGSHGNNIAYAWFRNGVATGVTTARFLGSYTSNVSLPPVRDQFVVRVTNTTTGCDAFDTIRINYNLRPIVNAGTDVTNCSPVLLKATSINQAANDNMTFNWFSSTGVLLSRSRDYNAQPGTYILQGSRNGCISFDTVVVKCNAGYTIVLEGEAGSEVVRLRWNKPVAGSGYDVDYYEVFYGYVDIFTPLRLAVTPDNFLQARDLINGNTYNFRVRAVFKNTSVSEFSNMISLRPSYILGNDQLDQQISLNVFPNPTTGVFDMELGGQKAGKINLRIVDLTGKVVYQAQQENFNPTYRTSVNLGEAASGMYIIHIETAQGSYQQKISVVR